MLLIAVCEALNEFKYGSASYCRSGYSKTLNEDASHCVELDPDAPFKAYTIKEGGVMLPCSHMNLTHKPVSGTHYYTSNTDDKELNFCDFSWNVKQNAIYVLEEGFEVLPFGYYCVPGYVMSVSGPGTNGFTFGCAEPLSAGGDYVKPHGVCLSVDYSEAKGQGHCMIKCPDGGTTQRTTRYGFLYDSGTKRLCQQCLNIQVPLLGGLECAIGRQRVESCEYYQRGTSLCAQCKQGLSLVRAGASLMMTCEKVTAGDDVTQKACRVYDTERSCILCDTEHVLASGKCVSAIHYHCVATDGEMCVYCQENYIFDPDGSCKLPKCGPGQFSSFSDDKTGHGGENCSDCKPGCLCEFEATNCYACLEGYGFTDEESGTCVQCTANCAQCDSETITSEVLDKRKCLDCKEGFFLGSDGLCRGESDAIAQEFPDCLKLDKYDRQASKSAGESRRYPMPFCVACDTGNNAFLYDGRCRKIEFCDGHYYADEDGVRCDCLNGIDGDSGQPDPSKWVKRNVCYFCYPGCKKCVPATTDEMAGGIYVAKCEQGEPEGERPCDEGYTYVVSVKQCARTVERCNEYKDAVSSSSGESDARASPVYTAECATCVPGYHPDSTALVCVPCAENCLQCTEEACTVPADGYYLTSGSEAIKCGAPCRLCSVAAANCTVDQDIKSNDSVLFRADSETGKYNYYHCAKGYAAQMPPVAATGAVCAPISSPGSLITNCALVIAVNSHAVCMKCDTGSFLYRNTCYKISGCIDYSIIFDEELNYNPEHPVECNCPVGTYLNAEYTACALCPKGCYHCMLSDEEPRSIAFAPSEVNKDGPDDASGTVCLSRKCWPTYEFIEVTGNTEKQPLGQCTLLPQNCYFNVSHMPLACSSSNCFEGFRYVNSSYCERCNIGCKKCDEGPSKCTECLQNYQRIGETCKVDCNVGYYRDTTCKRCGPGYAVCTGIGKCDPSMNPDCKSDTACIDGYRFSDGECKQCHAGCEKCNSMDECERYQCAEGYDLNLGKCHKCRVGCKTCSGSSKCVAASQLDCAEGFTYSLNDCHKQCGANYYNNVPYSCAKCPKIRYCAECLSAEACKVCQDGFVLEDGQCVISSTFRQQALIMLSSSGSTLSWAAISVIGALACVVMLVWSLYLFKKHREFSPV